VNSCCDRLKEEMRDFLLGKKTSFAKGDKCQLCHKVLNGERDKVTIGDLELFQCLLLDQNAGGDVNDDSIGHLLLCGSCASPFLQLRSHFEQLRSLAQEFNWLRRDVGRKIIVDSLGKSQQEWNCWEKEVKMVEGIYPFAAKELKRLITVINTNTTIKDELIGEDESLFGRKESDQERPSVRVPTNKITLPY